MFSAYIALTGHSTRERASQAREAGCVSFLVNPCPPGAMVSEIRRIMGDAKAGQP